MRDSLPCSLVCRGAWGTVEYAVCSKGSMPAREFFVTLTAKEQAQMLALFDKMAQIGRIHNREQFKKLHGDLWEFKKHQLRFGCFANSKIWVLAQGFRKKQDDWPTSELRRAERIMQEHKARST